MHTVNTKAWQQAENQKFITLWTEIMFWLELQTKNISVLFGSHGSDYEDIHFLNVKPRSLTKFTNVSEEHHEISTKTT